MDTGYNKYTEEFDWLDIEATYGVRALFNALHPNMVIDNLLLESVKNSIEVAYLIYRCLRGITVNSADLETFSRVEQDSKQIMDSIVSCIENPQMQSVQALFVELNSYYSRLIQYGFKPFTRLGGGAFSSHFSVASVKLDSLRFKSLLDWCLRAVDRNADQRKNPLLATDTLLTQIKASFSRSFIFGL